MTLATEPTTAPADEPQERKTLLEAWPQNERMRHIPNAAWILQKLDGDLRRRIDLLWSAYASLGADHPQHAKIEQELKTLCRSLDRLSDVARRHRGHPHPPNELGARIQWTLNQTVSNLNTVDAETFGRRFPFQTFERSFAEPLWAALLSVIEHVRRVTECVREADPNIDSRLYEGLVVLQTPLNPKPIA
jgi:hypothetical protein